MKYTYTPTEIKKEVVIFGVDWMEITLGSYVYMVEDRMNL